MIDNYYDTLGVHRKSNNKEIVAAFRKLARKYHPDVNKRNSFNEKKFKEINEAYQVLSDKKARKDYDHFGDNWRYADQIRSSTLNNSFGFGEGYNFRQNSNRDYFSLKDLFEFNSGANSKSDKVNHHEVEISVTLKELYEGTKRIIKLKERNNCTNCNSLGYVEEKKCSVCQGLGKYFQSKTLEVVIPKGLKDSGVVSIKRPESKVINIHVKQVKEKKFIRKEDDLYTSVNVDYLEAILGGDVLVHTMEKPISLKIPPGTRNSSLFRIKGRGMPIINSDKFGSLIVEVNVTIPSEITTEERELLENLRILGRG